MSCLVEDFKYIINVCAKCLGEGGREGGREGEREGGREGVVK